MRAAIGAVALALLTHANAPAAPLGLSPADRAAAFRAAGFKPKGRDWVRCDEPQSASSMPGFIELEDLNADGAPEAWVRESSTYCYGNTAEAFVLVTKKGAAWVVLLDEVGIAAPRPTRTMGWPDIEVGGPGPGPFPVYRYNGTRYLRGR